MRSSHSQAGSGAHLFKVAFICTGNRARSPFAAALLSKCVLNLPVSARSFGTLDLGVVPALPEARRVALAYGVDLATHQSTPLLAGDLSGFDLAVGFEPMHVASAVVIGGIPRERAFQLIELSDALGSQRSAKNVDCWAELLQLAHERRVRGTKRAVTIVDPVGRGAEVVASVFEEIAMHVAALAEMLFGSDCPEARCRSV